MGTGTQQSARSQPHTSSRGGVWGLSPGRTARVPDAVHSDTIRVTRSASPTLCHAAEVAFGDRALSWVTARVPNPVPCSGGGIWGQNPILVAQSVSPNLHQAAEVACGDRVLVAQRVSQTWCIWGTKCHPGGTVHVPNVGPSSRGGIQGTEPHPGGTAHVPNLVPAPGAVDMRGQSAQHTSQTRCIWGQNPHPHDTAHVPNLTRAPGVTLGDGTQQHCFGVAGRGRRSVGVPPQPRVPAHTRCPRPLM